MKEKKKEPISFILYVAQGKSWYFWNDTDFSQGAVLINSLWWDSDLESAFVFSWKTMQYT